MENNHLKAILISSLGVLFMSFESLLIKLASIEAVVFAFYVGIFMFISINTILFSTKKSKTILIYKEGMKAIIICGFLFGLSNIFFITAIKTTSVANTVMIFASAPLFSALYTYLIYKEKSKKNIYISSFFIAVGLFVIFSAQLGGGDLLGNIYALICVNLFALSFVVLAKHKNANRFAITAFAGLSAAVISFLFVNDFLIDISTLIILLLAGVIVAPISRVLMGIGTKSLPASEISLLFIIETVMAPIWVWIVLKEVPANSTFIGGSIILLTLFLNSAYILKMNKTTTIIK
ncbi:DMT family transporter [Poseidonibacter ostreae]|uniref:EamA family transporter n=1 Tax=Poseidonibacter ostreae TaxID=2654171 RepID=A0A6L4WSF0_9BACT|nr:DMT family transporter [Poseidonibacter ostreae]KAB7884665.1 EamA family transporter [Poseidonibacter ostreae]KAB7885942.1 EamA family transporter [Poseidonibacter ostreae]KAB7888595.1 EamA family transporter [Poseidonibacter ostreae]